MVELTQRQRALLAFLQGRSKFVTTQEIADHLGVSVRTVRNDLRVVSAYLDEKGGMLQRVPHVGIRLEGGDLPSTLVSENGFENATLNKLERAAVAEAMLLLLPVVTLGDIAEACGVSRQTATSDLCSVESLLRESGVRLRRRKGVGLSLIGDERDIRSTFFKLLTDASMGDAALSVVRASLLESSLARARELCHRFEEILGAVFVERETLSFEIAYVLSRIESGHMLEDCGLVLGPGLAGRLSEAGEGSFFEAIAGELGTRLTSEPERAYLAALIFAQRTTLVEDVSSTVEQPSDIAQAISRMLVDALHKIHLIDEKALQPLIDGLTNHLRAALYRCQNNMQVNDDLSQQIMSSISLLYDFTRQQMRMAEEIWGIAFSDGEIAYIALYLDCIYESTIRDIVRLKVLFVCAFGLASSSILMARLSYALADCDVVGPMPEASAQDYLRDHVVDLVISTSQFSCESAPVLVVPGLLGQDEINHIKNNITQLSYDKACALFLRSYIHSAETDGVIHQVGDYIGAEDVQVCESCESWQQAISLAAKPLLEKGLIEPRYVSRMISAVETYGPYMVLTPGTAYVHAGINDGARANCTALLALRHDLAFGTHGERMVRLVAVLGFHDKERNDLLGLASILEREENVRFIQEGSFDVPSLLALNDGGGV